MICMASTSPTTGTIQISIAVSISEMAASSVVPTRPSRAVSVA